MEKTLLELQAEMLRAGLKLSRAENRDDQLIALIEQNRIQQKAIDILVIIATLNEGTSEEAS